MAIYATTESGHTLVFHSASALRAYRKDVEQGDAERLQRTYMQRLTPNNHAYLYDLGQCFGDPCSLSR